MPQVQEKFTPSISPNDLARHCWALVEKTGFHSLTHHHISEATNLPFAEIKKRYPQQKDILNAMIDYIHRQAWGHLQPSDASHHASPQDDLSRQDLLLEGLMAYFDVLQPLRASFKVLWQEMWFHPLTLKQVYPQLLKISRALLTRAGIPHGDFLDHIKPHVLLGVCSTIIPIFLQDQSTDLSTTLAKTDQALQTLCQVQGWVNGILSKKTYGF